MANSVQLPVEPEATRGMADYTQIKRDICEHWPLIKEFLETRPDEELDAIKAKLKDEYPAGQGGELVALLLNKNAEEEELIEECGVTDDAVIR